MAAELIDGKKVAADIKDGLKTDIEELKSKGIKPGLAVVLVGQDPASKKYVSSKEKTCQALGIESLGHKLPADASQETILRLVDDLNKDPKVHGIAGRAGAPCSGRARISALHAARSHENA
jgi:methylenetetrahydrofolate dehydrogenase (NADP+)/methenyltetrahydrofolate cyclohydrolase